MSINPFGTRALRANIFVLLLFLSVVSAGFSAPPAAEIVYMEGTVDVYRDGTKIEAGRVDIGFIVEEFDMVETGVNGFVEMALSSGYGGGAVVQVEPDTSFYFGGIETEERRETEFSTMAGCMAYKVKKLSGNEAFRVRTESAVMGVRGTLFDVTISPEGSVLVTCEEGRVAVTDEEERSSYYSEPGQVVEKLTEQGVETRRVDPSQLEDYRSDWEKTRLEVFKRGAPTFIKSYGRRYMRYLPKFEEAYGELERHRRTLERFEGGEGASLGTAFKAKSEVSPAVVRMRSILPMFEHVFFRLQTLERYHSQGIGQGMIDSRTSSERFFRNYRSESRRVKRQLSETYYLLRLYQKLHQATGGGGPSLLDDPFGEGEGFGGGGMPDSMFD
mgnify:CR=1 FL=1